MRAARPCSAGRAGEAVEEVFGDALDARVGVGLGVAAAARAVVAGSLAVTKAGAQPSIPRAADVARALGE